MEQHSKRASRADRPEPMRAERDDPRVSPLGRGANPGTSVEMGPLTDSANGSVAGQRGMGVPNERGGPDGMVSRENEDSVPAARRDPRDYA